MIPSFEYAIELPPFPTATHLLKAELQATPIPMNEKIDVDPVAPFQLIPSFEYTIELPPFPTATVIVPFEATPKPNDEKFV